MRLIIVQKQALDWWVKCLPVGKKGQRMLLKPWIPPVCCLPSFLGNKGALKEGEFGPCGVVEPVSPQVSAQSVNLSDSV